MWHEIVEYLINTVLRLVWPFDGIVGDGLPYCCSLRVIVYQPPKKLTASRLWSTMSVKQHK